MDLRSFDPEELRRQIGFVPQETFLFSATLAENIAWGVPDANREQIRWAAEVAGLASDIETFPNGLDTVIGERGLTLSGGQKQRTAIARAILRNPRILILDDALSSVDTVTEEKILNGLAALMRDRTTILISHRVSTVQNADRIVVLSHGSWWKSARTSSCSIAAVIMQSFTRSNYSKRNWRRFNLCPISSSAGETSRARFQERLVPWRRRGALRAQQYHIAGADFKLGVASYSFRKFSRAQAIEMTKQLGTPYLNIKDVHLPA